MHAACASAAGSWPSPASGGASTVCRSSLRPWMPPQRSLMMLDELLGLVGRIADRDREADALEVFERHADVRDRDRVGGDAVVGRLGRRVLVGSVAGSQNVSAFANRLERSTSSVVGSLDGVGRRARVRSAVTLRRRSSCTPRRQTSERPAPPRSARTCATYVSPSVAPKGPDREDRIAPATLVSSTTVVPTSCSAYTSHSRLTGGADAR